MSHLLSPAEWVAPVVSLASLAILPAGPILFPRAYMVLLFVYFSVFLYTQVNHMCKFFLMARRLCRTINKTIQETPSLLPDANSTSRVDSPSSCTRERSTAIDIEEKLYHDDNETGSYIHAFIIPNYCEPEGLLCDTINRLASHRHAQTHYVIILAMEASEAGYEIKGQRLQERFEGRFLQFIVTGHPADIPGESRGKGSNVAYAARYGSLELSERIDRRRVIFTVTDADSAIPELYVCEVERELNRVDDPYNVLLAPPIFFSRNCFEVPAAVRVADITWSAMVMSNLGNARGLAFPCSTYSVSLALAERVGFWDTDADAVGEDMHMFLKCFFKTDGQARTIPIHVPINLTNVQTDSGYVANMNARFVQAKRHYNGVADVAYTLKNCITSKASLMDKLIVCLKVLEAHMIPVTSGWLMFAAVPLMQLVLFPPTAILADLVHPTDNPVLVSEFYATLWNLLRLITVLLPLPLFGTLVIYELMHRSVDRDLFHKHKGESRRWINLFDYVALPIAAWLYMTLPSTLASVKRLSKREQHYIVSEKVFREQIQELPL